VQHNNAILDFQRKRGDSSAAFVLPFLNEAMDVLDVGCGPGTITAALARTAKSAVGIDISAKAIVAAHATASSARLPKVGFIRGTMTALPFDDDSFDAVFFHAVLYHLDAATLAAALSEARRVLKPGGLVATRDADVGGNILHPESAGLLLALDLWTRWYEHADPESVRFGRRQSAILRAHGFAPVWNGASFVNHSADETTRRESVTDAKHSLQGMSADLIARGLASRDEIEQALSAWDAWGGNPDSVYLRCRCECVARKAG
jgi:SAM-dependent methyltransferase